MNNRIRKIRKHYKLSQTAFGAKIGVTLGVIKNFEQGKTKLDSPLLELLCSIYNVNETWLRTGEGEMFNPSVALTNDLQKEHNLSPQAATMLQNFLELSKSEQDQFVELAEKIFNNNEQNDNIILYKDVSQNETEIFAADSSSPDTDSLIFHKQNK